MVAVLIRGRPFEQVAGDLVEGVVVANRLDGACAERIRQTLLAAVAPPTVGDDPPGWRNRQTQAA